MHFPPTSSINGADPGTLFLLTRWHELFDRYTPDSYRAKLNHLPALVEEIRLMCNREPYHEAWGKHLAQVKQELKHALEKQSNIQTCTPKQVYLLDQLHQVVSIKKLKHLANHLCSEGFKEAFEASAIEVGVKQLNQSLSDKAKGKKNANDWLELWSTISSRRSTAQTIDFDNPSVFKSSLGDTVHRVQKSISPVESQYTCILELCPVGDDEGISNNIRAVVRKLRLNPISPNEIPQLQVHPRSVIVRIEHSSSGPEVALEKAIREVQPALNLLGFYSNAAVIEPLTGGWVGESPANLVFIRFSNLVRLFPRRNATELTKHALDSLKSNKAEAVILNALELHQLALSVDDRRVGFITLWSALECLAAYADGPSIISRVLNLVSPVIAWRRIDKQLRYLAMNYRFLFDAYPDRAEAIGNPLPNATGREVPVEDILLALTKPKNHPDILSLFKLAEGSPLLIWRTFQLWQVFSDSKKLAKGIDESRTRLGWHLWRIYRARNLLVHDGIEVPGLPTLFDNLQYYFSTTVSRLIHGLSKGGHKSLEDSALSCSTSYDFLRFSLENGGRDVTVNELIPNPTRARDAHPWRH